MILKQLTPEEIKSTIGYLQDLEKEPSNELFRRVWANETSLEEEASRLKTMPKEEYDKHRDDLLSVLSGFELGELEKVIKEEDVKFMSHKSLQEELIRYNKQYKKYEDLAISFNLIGLLATFLSFSWASYYGPGLGPSLGIGGGIPSIMFGMYCYAKKEGIIEDYKYHGASGTYNKILENARNADRVIRDYKFLKENWLVK